MNKKLSWSELLRLKEQKNKNTPHLPPINTPKLFFEDFTLEELEALEEFEKQQLEEINEHQKYYYYEQI